MPSDQDNLLEELQDACGAEVKDKLQVLLEGAKEDLLPEVQHIAKGLIKVGKAYAQGDKDAAVIWASLLRQSQSLHALCYRRGWEAGLDIVGQVAGIALSVVLKRLGV